MSAITGMSDLRAISGSASASSWLGTATRTTWQPEAVENLANGSADKRAHFITQLIADLREAKAELHGLS